MMSQPARKVGRRKRVSNAIVGGLVLGGARIACWLPGWPMWKLADFAGSVSYRVSGARRDRARRNLRRIVQWMAANHVGPEEYRRAATDDRALEKVVKSLFRHHIRYYVEAARAPRVNARFFAEHVVIETPEIVDEAFARGQSSPLIMLALHFGPVEMPAIYAAGRLKGIVAPTEVLGNPGIQKFIVDSRERVGLQLVPMEEGATAMPAALREGKSLGIIADRDMTGGGIEVELFGGKAKIPVGPVLLGLQHNVPVYVCGMRRTATGGYRANLREVLDPGGPSKRERMHTMAQAEAHIFEQIIVDAPDQWLAAFHRVWPDLEETAVAEKPDGQG